jgi:hypothetical protein
MFVALSLSPRRRVVPAPPDRDDITMWVQSVLAETKTNESKRALCMRRLTLRCSGRPHHKVLGRGRARVLRSRALARPRADAPRAAAELGS